jgi:hypothetical protein
LEGIEKYKKEGIINDDYNITQIPIDNITRWNSTYYMIKTALELKEPLIYISKNTTNIEYKRNILTDNEWLILIELRNIFEIFVKPSTKLQGSLYITLNMSLLYIYQIYNKLNNLKLIYKEKVKKSNSYNYLILAIDSGIDKLNKYFPVPENITLNILKTYYKPFILNIILDPRFKIIHFKQNGLLYFYNNIEKDIINIFKNEYVKIKSEIKGKSTIDINISFDELNEDILNQSNSDSDDELYIQTEKNQEEYIIYLNEINESKNIDPLIYWKNNSYKFPILSILARRYLAIPATSASIESTFSIGNNIITKSRNRLKSETVKQLVLLKSWKIKDLKELEIVKENEKENE